MLHKICTMILQREICSRFTSNDRKFCIRSAINKFRYMMMLVFGLPVVLIFPFEIGSITKMVTGTMLAKLESL